MTTTFLDGVHQAAAGKAVVKTIVIRTEADLKPLSYYSLCALSDTFHINPFGAARHGEAAWEVDLDDAGAFVAARFAAKNCYGCGEKLDREDFEDVCVRDGRTYCERRCPQPHPDARVRQMRGDE